MPRKHTSKYKRRSNRNVRRLKNHTNRHRSRYRNKSRKVAKAGWFGPFKRYNAKLNRRSKRSNQLKTADREKRKRFIRQTLDDYLIQYIRPNTTKFDIMNLSKTNRNKVRRFTKNHETISNQITKMYQVWLKTSRTIPQHLNKRDKHEFYMVINRLHKEPDDNAIRTRLNHFFMRRTGLPGKTSYMRLLEAIKRKEILQNKLVKAINNIFDYGDKSILREYRTLVKQTMARSKSKSKSKSKSRSRSRSRSRSPSYRLSNRVSQVHSDKELTNLIEGLSKDPGLD